MLEYPVILHVPHSSTYIPRQEKTKFLISDDELKNELLVMTDWYVDELFNHKGLMKHVNPYSRLVFDPERFRNDSEEEMSILGMGAIYTKTSGGKKLRDVTPEEREAMLRQYYDPYHEAFTESVEECLHQFGQCLIIDAHSFSSKPLNHEMDKSEPRPNFCIGYDSYHTPAGVPRLAYEFFFWGEDESVSLNNPFFGTIVPMRYYRTDQRVKSIMIEVNRSLYMDESNGRKLDTFDYYRSMMSRFIQYMTEVNC